MADGTKIQITLSETVMQKLKILCNDKGVKRSAVIAWAIDKLYREGVGSESK